jgi:REP element-mobilizing transposase RayT
MPVFEDAGYDRSIREFIRAVLLKETFICPVWEVMPTHVHAIIGDFADLARGKIVMHLKGATSYAFFARYPFLRDDLLGGHLWSKGYYWVPIESHGQYRATVEYITSNRTRVGLVPPAPLQICQTD